MIPCGRGADVLKSASVWMILKQLQANHKDDAKTDPNTIWKCIKDPSQKRCGKTSETFTKKMTRVQMMAPNFEANYLLFYECCVFVPTCVSEAMRGYPETSFKNTTL